MSAADRQVKDFILLGLITRAHGIRGDVKVHPYTATPEDFVRYPRLFLSSDNGLTTRPCNALQVRVQGKGLIFRLEGCATREAAEKFAGQQVWVAKIDLPPIAAHEFYLHTLEGKRAITESGTELGTIKGLVETKAQHLLIIGEGTGEYLVPATGEFLLSIDEDKVVLALPPGLLEINR